MTSALRKLIRSYAAPDRGLTITPNAKKRLNNRLAVEGENPFTSTRYVG
jgi:hypothetical protein